MKKTFKIEGFIRTNKRINKLSAKQAVKLKETERKFIIMSRIAVALHRKGLACSVDILDSGFCCLTVFLHTQGECEIVEKTGFDNKPTEAELLDWWSAIENGVE